MSPHRSLARSAAHPRKRSGYSCAGLYGFYLPLIADFSGRILVRSYASLVSRMAEAPWSDCRFHIPRSHHMASGILVVALWGRAHIHRVSRLVVVACSDIFVVSQLSTLSRERLGSEESHRAGALRHCFCSLRVRYACSSRVPHLRRACDHIRDAHSPGARLHGRGWRGA